VYLNGKLDNGFLLGSVTGEQHSSRSAVYVGRGGDPGFEFAGSIDDVHIYSFALTKAEIAADMRGRVDGSAVQRAVDPGYQEVPCRILSDHEDARIPAAAAMVGVLVAVACIGLWPSTGALFCLTVSFAAGLVLLPATSSNLPLLGLWMMPLLSLAGGAFRGWLSEASELTQRSSLRRRKPASSTWASISAWLNMSAARW
jgi:hypothetical protein